MSTNTLIEQRLTAVEKSVKELEQRFAAGGPDPNWIQRITGILQDSPAFGEVIELGRKIRAADRPDQDQRP